MSEKISESPNINKVKLKEQASAPATPPPTGYWYLFPKDDGLYVMDDAGTVTGPMGTGGGTAVNFNVNGSLIGSGDTFDFKGWGGISLVGSQSSPVDPMILKVILGGGVLTKTANYNVAVTDAKILADTSGAGFTLTLPPPGDCAVGQQFTIKKISSDGNTLTISPNSAEDIEGTSSKTLTSQWEYATLFTNGTDWFLM